MRPEAEQSAEAAAGLVRTYRESLAELHAAGKPTSAAAAAAVAAIETTSGITRTPPESYNAEQLATVLAVANILLEYTDDGAGKAERLIDATLEESKAATDEWKASAHALVAYALAAQGRIEDAQRQLENVAGAGTASLQALVEGLDRLCATAQPALKRNLATLELHALALIKDRSTETSRRSTA